MLKFLAKILFLGIIFFKCDAQAFAQETEAYNIISEIKIIGNKTTKNKIIIRELPFAIGDSVKISKLTKRLERAQSNLMNTLLFNFVTLETVYFDSLHISIYIAVEERWYWWPVPIFEVQENNFNSWWQTKNFDRASYGLFLAKENFRGRKERIAFQFQKGYTEKFGVKYANPYINKKRTHGMDIKINYSRNHEINYGTTANKFSYYKSNSNFIRKDFKSALGYEIRPKLYNKHHFQIAYRNINISDSVVLFNDDYLTKGANNTEFLSLNYTLIRDKRNFKSYPTKGYFYSFQLNQDGFSVFDDKINSFYSTVDYRKFIPLSNRFYFSAGISGKYSFTKASYYLQSGFGFASHLVRGYELYVIKGDHYGLFKSQLRYGMIQNKVFRVKPLPFSQFDKIPLSIYMGIYFDAGYVDSQRTQKTNFLTNKVLTGGGVSLDFMSYYDVVFRIEYSINKLGETGLYLHFVAPI